MNPSTTAFHHSTQSVLQTRWQRKIKNQRPTYEILGEYITLTGPSLEEHSILVTPKNFPLFTLKSQEFLFPPPILRSETPTQKREFVELFFSSTIPTSIVVLSNVLWSL